MASQLVPVEVDVRQPEVVLPELKIQIPLSQLDPGRFNLGAMSALPTGNSTEESGDRNGLVGETIQDGSQQGGLKVEGSTIDVVIEEESLLNQMDKDDSLEEVRSVSGSAAITDENLVEVAALDTTLLPDSSWEVTRTHLEDFILEYMDTGAPRLELVQVAEDEEGPDRNTNGVGDHDSAPVMEERIPEDPELETSPVSSGSGGATLEVVNEGCASAIESGSEASASAQDFEGGRTPRRTSQRRAAIVARSSLAEMTAVLNEWERNFKRGARAGRARSTPAPPHTEAERKFILDFIRKMSN